ncbi:AraC family transcriptional regulator [Clostridium saccharobutylicum]|uniref:Melibiose operon regulatory protein n=1 Tax=Clostridium saccharobutylicum TaxID=169679 RepID=A0A1S8N2I4_CLOSA|nr:AraC family transcriptional regulator [Clostridium saccharobutylicum]OOM10726.1 melibiose operon regulatory protein [Clostridium saccharobutylicum]
MQSSKIEVDENLQETKKHGSYDFPIEIYTDKFNLFEDGYIRYHWHKEIQFSFCLHDKVVFFIGNQKITLEPGDGIMVNSNVLHQIKPYENNNCMMFSIDFDPTLIGGNKHSLIEKKYVNPIIENNNLKFISLKSNVQWQKNILNLIKKIFSLWNERPYGYELEIQNYLGSLWLNVIREMKEELKEPECVASHDEERVKIALKYIHEHYSENISLNDIAMIANISKSECCRSFKRILRVTPFEYLMEYRALKSSELLLKSKKSISNIAFDVGFNGTSYLGKVFKKYMNCTPSEYRNKYNVK